MTIFTTIRTLPTSLPQVAGIAVPGFICNGTYFFTELDVFADGLVRCWDVVDLDFLEQKLRQGWVSPGVPDGEDFGVYEVIDGIARRGKWTNNRQAFHEHLLGYMRDLNPSMSELVDFEGTDVELRDGINYAKVGWTEATPRREVNKDEIPGAKSRFALVNEKGQFYLTSLRIYAEGTIDCHPKFGEERLIDLDEFKTLVRKNIIGCNLADGETIEIDGLGRFEAEDIRSCVRRKSDFVKDISGTIDELNGQIGAVQQCREAFAAYCKDPTQEGKLKLKELYEAIPEHHRMFVGDMDKKDIPVRMAIYGDEEIENWSHRIVARSLGDNELPTISVPKPKDKDNA